MDYKLSYREKGRMLCAKSVGMPYGDNLHRAKV
jgi:hypothetical protein